MKNIELSEDEVEKIIPMKLEDIARDMSKTPEKYTMGFISTLNYYIRYHDLNIPLVELR